MASLGREAFMLEQRLRSFDQFPSCACVFGHDRDLRIGLEVPATPLCRADEVVE
jgi:hypothetical protein